MKYSICMFVFLLIVSTTYAQSMNGESVTDRDVEIRFPGAAMDGVGDWYNPAVVSIAYSILPLGQHGNKVKLGLQGWDFELQAGRIPFEKCYMVIDVPTMPPGFRVMEIRVRVREDDNNGVPLIGPWSDVNNVKIIGKTSNPFRTG